MKGGNIVSQKIVSRICVIGLILALLVPSLVQAQDATPEEEDAVYYVGSVFLSLLYFPIKLVTCVGVQTVTIPTYLFTNGVPGNFEGGTNQKEIAEIARAACVVPWVVPFDQVKEDYQ